MKKPCAWQGQANVVLSWMRLRQCQAESKLVPLDFPGASWLRSIAFAQKDFDAGMNDS
jgi:hypothetical protein